jgi:hypothetical protein
MKSHLTKFIWAPCVQLYSLAETQGVIKRCRLSWLTNSALVYESKCGGMEEVAGSQPVITAVHHVTWSPNKLWRANSLLKYFTYTETLQPPSPRIWEHIRGRYWSVKIDDMPVFLWIIISYLDRATSCGLTSSPQVSTTRPS